MIRQFVQKVVGGKTHGHQPATLEVHGRIAYILAAMDAATIIEERLRLLQRHDCLGRCEADEVDTEQKRRKLLDIYAEEFF